jgi:cytochrome c-type biogenesis protein CcmE
MSPKARRLTLLFAVIAALAAALTLVLSALNRSITFFYTPSDIAAAMPEGRFRLGGLVEPGSVTRLGEDGELKVGFTLTDGRAERQVVYAGLLPDLFGEGKGAVAAGKMGPGGVFEADQVLAKHDENYHPPELEKGLQRAAGSEAP